MKLLGNSYVLGILMLITEGLVNLIAGFTLISGIILSFSAGHLYAWRHKARMPHKEKIKVLVVYLGFILVLLVPLVFLTKETSGEFVWIIAIAVAAFFAIYGLAMYAGLTTGSHFYMKSRDKKLAQEQENRISPESSESGTLER